MVAYAGKRGCADFHPAYRKITVCASVGCQVAQGSLWYCCPRKQRKQEVKRRPGRCCRQASGQISRWDRADSLLPGGWLWLAACCLACLAATAVPVLVLYSSGCCGHSAPVVAGSRRKQNSCRTSYRHYYSTVPKYFTGARDLVAASSAQAYCTVIQDVSVSTI